MQTSVFSTVSTGVRREPFVTNKHRLFLDLSKDYQQLICNVITDYQKREFGVGTPIQMKKELLRSLGFSPNLARMVIDEDVVGVATMFHCLDLFEDILNLYDEDSLYPGRAELLERKKQFIKKYVIRVDMKRPIVQKV